jgi:hypothetical protein
VLSYVQIQCNSRRIGLRASLNGAFEFFRKPSSSFAVLSPGNYRFSLFLEKELILDEEAMFFFGNLLNFELKISVFKVKTLFFALKTSNHLLLFLELQI